MYKSSYNFKKFTIFEKNKTMSLGVKLRKLRDTKSWSQTEIADRLRVSQPAYHLWETDQAKPTTENLLRIAEIYNLDLYSLLDTQDQNIINNSTFQDNSSVQQQYYPTINNMVSPELLESVFKNQEQITSQQEQITKLIESQNKLIENLLKK
ncbi:hypothetical protein GCM10022217_17180 [Chryseobacterium ginsenosidimutans]|uniref:helix-turn-helix domain-containing protein n=1 Tax=Chryseobacterium ginsenosidimutans TaxID=687846 RepID=UPI0031E11E54